MTDLKTIIDNAPESRLREAMTKISEGVAFAQANGCDLDTASLRDIIETVVGTEPRTQEDYVLA